MKWQPIETAPKDGTHILAYWPDIFGDENATQAETWWGRVSSHNPASPNVWHNAYETGVDELAPTHWMPLPPPPGGDDA